VVGKSKSKETIRIRIQQIRRHSMNITLPRGELKQAVQGISKVAGKSTIPVLQCVRIEAGAQGVVAQGTNLDELIECRLDGAQVNGDGACIIPLTALRDLAKGSKNECIDIELEDPLDISVTNHVGGHAVRRTIAGLELAEWPDVQADVETKPANGFLDTYRRLTAFSSRDETRYTINSVYVEVGTGETPVTMVATDGRRLSSWNSMSLPIKESVVLPLTKFLSWNRMPEDVEIGSRTDADSTWFGVQAGPFTYSVKTIDGIYPNFRQVIPAEPGEHLIWFTDEDVDLLRQVLSTLPGGDDITLIGQDGKVTMYGRDPDEAQWATVTLESTTYSGDRAFFGVNRWYLLDALDAGFREFALADELSPLLSKDANGGTHVLMPLRVDDPEGKQKHVDDAVVSPDGVVDAQATPVDPAATSASVEPQPTQPKKRRNRKMPKPDEQKNNVTGLDHVLVTCDVAKARLKEAGQVLTELSKAIREASREQKTKEKEVEAAKAAIAKVQSIKLAA
jgi:DNA polymerase III sliding clamp (beta) subunit (PCNA family)